MPSHFWRLILGLAQLAALTFRFIDAVQAQEPPALFDGDQFTAVDLVPKQSTGGLNSLFESVQENLTKFQLVGALKTDDPFRQLGRSIGRLKVHVERDSGTKITSICTAALIGNDRILTNAHCLGTGSETALAAEVRFGYLQFGGEGSQSFEVSPIPLEIDPRLDFAILNVIGAPQNSFPILNRTIRAARDDERLFIVHHPVGLTQRLTRISCRAFPYQATDKTAIKHQCLTKQGSSGSLIFAESDGAIVGLHHTGGYEPADDHSYSRGTDALLLRGASPILTAALNGPVPTPATEIFRTAPMPETTAQSPEAAREAAKFIAYTRYGMEGNDIREIATSTKQECKAACVKAKGCVAYSIDIWNNGRCWLKSQATDLVASPQYFTAIVEGQKPKFDRSRTRMNNYFKKVFSDRGYRQGSARTYDECKDRCGREARCSASTFYRAFRICKLIEAPGLYADDETGDSSVKTQYRP